MRISNLATMKTSYEILTFDHLKNWSPTRGRLSRHAVLKDFIIYEKISTVLIQGYILSDRVADYKGSLFKQGFIFSLKPSEIVTYTPINLFKVVSGI